MNDASRPVAVRATDVPPRGTPSTYPEPFASRMAGRTKRSLGAVFGLSNFGVNLTELAPGGVSALRHAHATQDEFVYVLRGRPVLRTDAGDTPLAPGMCAGFRAGSGDAHQLLNPTGEPVVYLEIGDRSPGDTVHYPDDDLRAALHDGRWVFTHKDGRPYADSRRRDAQASPPVIEGRTNR
ncbi:MAG: cupin domain-containing protein [Rubrivivax sp.]|nr:cupin domain-containing protein [Rubrivivax sp.]